MNLLYKYFRIFLQHWLRGHSNQSIPREFKERNCKRKIPGEYCCFRQCTVSVTLLHIGIKQFQKKRREDMYGDPLLPIKKKIEIMKK